MDSLEEVQKKRWSVLFHCVNLAPFGALFWVDEEVWNAKAGPEYVRNKTRSNHPGCSIMRRHNTLGPVPLLHGTSKKREKKEVIAVKNVYGMEHTTWFGGLDPIFVGYELWSQKKIRPAEKGKVDALEHKALEALCAQKDKRWFNV